MQAAKRVAVNTGILYARMAITVFISLYSTRLILFALGSNDFGIFNLVGGTIAMLGFLNTSMAAATQRFMSYAQGAGNPERLKRIFNVSLLLHLIIAVILIFFLEIAGFFFFQSILNIPPDRIEAAKIIYQVMIISMLFTVVSVPYDAVINSHENMLLFALLGILESIIKLGIAFYITELMGDRLVMYGILMASLSVFLLLVRYFYCKSKYEECVVAVRENYDNHLMKEMTTFAGWSFLGSCMNMIANYGQGIVLNMFFGTVVNAAQGIANQISGQLSVFAGTMLKALNPLIAKSEGAGDRSLMLNASMMGSKISFFLLTVFFVPVLIEMPYILKIWLKEVPLFTILFCQLLLVRNLIEQLFVTLVSSISAVGKIRNFQIFASTLTFFPLLVSYFLCRNGYPAHTLYVVFIIYSIIASINILYFTHKLCGLSIPFFLKEVILRCVLSFVIALALSSIPLFVMAEGFPRLLCVLLISFISLVFLVYTIGITKSERLWILHVTKSTLDRYLPKTKRFTSFLGLKYP
jgi:Na+-driven multidrug efflux pump